MLDVSLYVNQAIDYLKQQDLEGFNKQFMYQKEELNSQDFNYTMQNIENNLEILYEKTRLIEALINYAKEFVKTNIYDTTDECQKILNDIEDNIDSIRAKNYISTSIDFENSTGSYLDRNGIQLNECAVYENKLTLSNHVNNELEIKSVTLTNNLIPYKSNIGAIKSGNPYRSFYLLDGPVNDGLKEEIYVEFKTPSNLNQLEILTSNCELLYVEYKNDNGTIEHIEKNFNVSHKDRIVKGITFVLKANNYNTLTYYIDETRAKPNYWDTIKANIYDTLSGQRQAMTQAEIDELTGLKAFKKAYDSYCFKVDTWISERKAIMNTNISNGYGDEVETVDFIVAPNNINNFMNSTLASSYAELTHDYTISSIGSNIISTDTSLNKQPVSANKTHFYPDAETMRYQKAYAESLPEYISKTGKPINLYTTIGKKLNYTSVKEEK